MGLAVVPVDEGTDQARLEVSHAAHPLAAIVPGRVKQTALQLGRTVTEGDVLLELDATDSQLALRAKQALVTSLESRRVALEKEIDAERATLESQKQGRVVGRDEAQAKITQAQSHAKFAAGQAERAKKLHASNTIPIAEAEKLFAEAETSAAALTEVQAALQRMDRDRLALENERQTRIVRLERETVELQGESDIELAAIQRLEHDISEHQLRAPISGRIGEVVEVRVGSVIAVAQKLGAIIPPGSPRAVAQFSPVVVGRLKPGQPARLRLAGFPWTQYGTVPAKVSNIDTEPRDGLIRVELTLHPLPTSRIPLEHGLTGSVEIEVERVTPAVLLLRASGQYLGTRRRGTP